MHTANRLRRWGTIVLNYNFKMGFQPSKKLCHAAGLSRLILKHREPLKDTVIASLRTGEFKTTLCNTVRELTVTLDQIKQEALNNKFIRQTKTKICEKDQDFGYFLPMR